METRKPRHDTYLLWILALLLLFNMTWSGGYVWTET